MFKSAQIFFRSTFYFSITYLKPFLRCANQENYLAGSQNTVVSGVNFFAVTSAASPADFGSAGEFSQVAK